MFLNQLLTLRKPFSEVSIVKTLYQNFSTYIRPLAIYFTDVKGAVAYVIFQILIII